MKIITIGEKFKNQKFDMRETCFGICEKNGKILLTKKINKNEIAMVGGGVEDNESHEVCLKREFMEESGYNVMSIKEFCKVDCFWLAGGQWPMRSIANIYIVETTSECLDPTEEGHEAIWEDLANCEKLLPLPYHKEAIRQYVNFKKNQ